MKKGLAIFMCFIATSAGAQAINYQCQTDTSCLKNTECISSSVRFDILLSPATNKIIFVEYLASGPSEPVVGELVARGDAGYFEEGPVNSLITVFPSRKFTWVSWSETDYVTRFGGCS